MRSSATATMGARSSCPTQAPITVGACIGRSGSRSRATMTEQIRLIEHLPILKLEPGDVLVLTYPEMLTALQAEALREQMAEALPGFPAVVLSGGVQLGAVRDERDEIEIEIE